MDERDLPCKTETATRKMTQTMTPYTGKGKGSIYHVTQQLEEAKKHAREKKSKEELFMEKEYRINDRFAKNNSHVVFFKDTCYKVTGSATFKNGYSWRCGHAKYHISPDEKDPDTDEHYIFMVIGDKHMKMDDETVEWPEFDEDIYNETMAGRELISKAKWKHKVLTDELTLKMKDDLHHIRIGKTRKRKAECFSHGKGKKGKYYE
jgi:hypothetical protein